MKHQQQTSLLGTVSRSASCPQKTSQQRQEISINNNTRSSHFVHHYTHPSTAFRAHRSYCENKLVNQTANHCRGQFSTSLENYPAVTARSVSSSSSAGECSTTNWVRLLRNKRASYPDFNRIWPNLHKNQGNSSALYLHF
jgi:hypothetical protein